MRICIIYSIYYFPVSQKGQWCRFVYKIIRDLESIDHLCINPIHRIGLIHKWAIDSHMLKWSVHVSVLLSNCKQSITSLSLLVGTTVGFVWNIFLLVLTLYIPINNFSAMSVHFMGWASTKQRIKCLTQASCESSTRYLSISQIKDDNPYSAFHQGLHQSQNWYSENSEKEIQLLFIYFFFFFLGGGGGRL